MNVYGNDDSSDQQYHNLNIKILKCSYCSQVFTQKYHFVRHQGTHFGEKPFQCSHCKKSFNIITNLFRHEKLHTGEKHYQCNFCDQSFVLNNSRKIHERIHTGEKPYQCSHCNKYFTMKCHLVRHERTHTGEKPNQCSNKKIHTYKKPYECIQCGSFIKKSDMKKHKKIHTCEKPYKCSQCGERCIEKSIIEKHKKILTCEKRYNFSDTVLPHESVPEANFVQYNHLSTFEIKMKCIICEHYLKYRNLISEKSHQCSYCEKRVCCELHLVRHRKKHIIESVPTDMNQHIEPKPGSFFDYKEDHLLDVENKQNTVIIKHNKLQSLEIKIQCIICKGYMNCKAEIFKSKNSRSETSYQCRNCEKRFCCELHLVRHNNKHIKEKQFCEIKMESTIPIISEREGNYNELDHNFEEVYREIKVEDPIQSLGANLVQGQIGERWGKYVMCEVYRN